MHLRYTTEARVVAFLRGTYTHRQGPPWAYAVNGGVAIYLDCYPTELLQFDDDAWLSLIHELKALPAVTVVAHVMTRHVDNRHAVPAVVNALLGEFQGVAQTNPGVAGPRRRSVRPIGAASPHADLQAIAPRPQCRPGASPWSSGRAAAG
jgi:hypothetical protein